VAFAFALDQSLIPPYLMKQDRIAHERNDFHTTSMASGISMALATFLEMQGFHSAPVAANAHYRSDVPKGVFGLYPNISHRYLAVRSGVGCFGLSGNVITSREGAAVILGAMVTTAELVPTDLLPSDENYCDSCGLCMASCASGFVDLSEKVSVAMGGLEFSYAKRGDYNRCGYLCGGYTGLHPSGKWSTWSPGRFPIPENDGDLLPAMLKAMEAHGQWPEMEGGTYNSLTEDKVHISCGHCQLVCSPDKEERQRRHKMLTENGVIVQNPDGSLEAVPPKVAIERLSSMDSKVRALYEDIKYSWPEKELSAHT
jgi:epoxyqueuosine reductase QueG